MTADCCFGHHLTVCSSNESETIHSWEIELLLDRDIAAPRRVDSLEASRKNDTDWQHRIYHKSHWVSECFSNLIGLLISLKWENIAVPSQLYVIRCGFSIRLPFFISKLTFFIESFALIRQTLSITSFDFNKFERVFDHWESHQHSSRKQRFFVIHFCVTWSRRYLRNRIRMKT